jgi:hypothetical protein
MFSYLDGEGLVVMTNRSSGFHIYQELLSSTASVYDWPDFRIAEHTLFPIKPEEDKIVGKYGFIQITKAGDGLECELGGDGRKMPIYASSASHFFALGASNEFEFAAEANGDTTSVRFITPTFAMTVPRSK